jgi:spore coat polysaccharide biosynthesis protein SpsF
VLRVAATRAVVVQARVGSSRLPGKVLAPFGSCETLLEHILGRLDGPWTLCVATSELAADDAVARVCESADIAVFRGSHDDVLDRYARCVEALPERPELVVRICADRPFVGAALVAELLDRYETLGSPDYLANSHPRKSYPDGFDVEVVRAETLLEAAAEAEDPYEREHVTPFVLRRPDRYRVAGQPCPYGDFSWVRATIDTSEDLVALRAVAEALPAGDLPADVLNLATLRPELFP